MKTKTYITYVYRARIERDRRWHGYSQDSADGFPTYTWMTKRKAASALFYTPPGPEAKKV